MSVSGSQSEAARPHMALEPHGSYLILQPHGDTALSSALGTSLRWINSAHLGVPRRHCVGWKVFLPATHLPPGVSIVRKHRVYRHIFVRVPSASRAQFLLFLNTDTPGRSPALCGTASVIQVVCGYLPAYVHTHLQLHTQTPPSFSSLRPREFSPPHA